MKPENIARAAAVAEEVAERTAALAHMTERAARPQGEFYCDGDCKLLVCGVLLDEEPARAIFDILIAQAQVQLDAANALLVELGVEEPAPE